MRINFKYLAAFFILFITEVFIAIFVKDKIIRPFVGDILVVILMYTFIRGFTQKPKKGLPLYLFIFAVMVEMAQFYHLVDRLGMRNNKLIATIIGTSFDIRDILCYFAGMVILVAWERVFVIGERKQK